MISSRRFASVNWEKIHERLGDAEIFEQLPGPPCVFGRNDVALAPYAPGAQREVLQVANRRGDQVKRGGRARRKLGFRELQNHFSNNLESQFEAFADACPEFVQ